MDNMQPTEQPPIRPVAVVMFERPYQPNLPALVAAIRITMGQGNTNFRGNFAVPLGTPMGYGRAGKPVSAPAWFLKMDRNGDGDISPREWLGTEEEFRMIDTDGVLDARLPRPTALTPYARMGDLPTGLVLALALAVVIRSRRRSPKAPAKPAR